jgi:hypothetical protein
MIDCRHIGIWYILYLQHIKIDIKKKKLNS